MFEPMTPKEALEKAKQIMEKFGNDPTESHWHLDNLMYTILTDCGYGEMVGIFLDSTRRYE